MIKSKKWVFFSALICLYIFMAIPSADGQTSYDSRALGHFKTSLENLIHGDYEKAIESCNQVLRIDPNSAVTYTIRARAYYEMGDFDKAIADCTQAIRLDKNNVSAFSIRGSAQVKKGDYNKAISDWEAALKINPNVTDLNLNIEKARQERGD
jgi:tetratricopeptide (TPR) repeat protein